VLRATDREHFSEDPLRGLRVAQLAARLEMTPDAELIRLCARLDLSELPGERCFAEFRKLLLKGRRPSLGFDFLRAANLLRFFPELEALVGVPQDAEWHPEGDVWVHTLMVLDAAANLRDGGNGDEALMFGALCHDFGKPATTETLEGRIRSRGHDFAGIEPSKAFLERMRAPRALVVSVVALVHHHLTPTGFDTSGATERAYRRLARKLDAAGVTLQLLGRVARADHLGRTTPDALAGRAAPIDAFLSRAAELAVERESPPDVVLGRHLIARGLEPGKHFGEILSACRDVQDETGSTDPDEILRRVLCADSE
jgi:tRNA nucleotidyltransferase (CCA-adding enzyme)